jgi:hypothetical protein
MRESSRRDGRYVMTQLRRMAFEGAAVLSALLCAAVCLLWARSYRHDLDISNNASWTATGAEIAPDWEPRVPCVGYSEWRFEWLAGRVAWRSYVVRLNLRYNPAASIRPSPEGAGLTVREFPKMAREIEEDMEPIGEEERKILDNQGWLWEGFGYSCNRAHQFLQSEANGSEIELRAIVPDWSLAIVLAVVPACRITLRIRAARRFRTGLCVCRGYDLRATADRCPECGTVPKGNAAS